MSVVKASSVASHSVIMTATPSRNLALNTQEYHATHERTERGAEIETIEPMNLIGNNFMLFKDSAIE